MRAVVLYEDQRGPTKEFGLHNLVASCIADRRGETVWIVRRQFAAIPKKGNSKLLKACKEDEQLAGSGQKVIAVFDGDEVRAMLGLPTTACRTLIKQKIEAGCPFAEQLSVVLLEDNIESVIAALRRCEGTAPETARAEAERSHGNLESRDRLLNTLAYDVERRALRDCVLREMPSLERLVSTLAALLPVGT